MIAVATVSILVLIVLGVAVAFAFGGAAFLYLFLDGSNVATVPSVAFYTIDSFTYLAIPFFLLAGAIMQSGGISRRLVDFVASLVGRVRGGMAATVVGASALFGSISGSSVATVSAVGRIMTDGMVARGYPRSFVGGLTAVCGILGILIPPSVPMIVYGTSAGVSIGDMFLAGITSGVLMAVLLTVNVLVWARRQPQLNDRGPDGASPEHGPAGANRRRRLTLTPVGRFGAALPALLTPVIILGGIYSGLFTPTESGALACAYGLLVGMFVYRELKPSAVGGTLLNGILATAPILLIIAMGGVFARVLLLSGVPQDLAAWVNGLDIPVWALLLTLNLVLLIVGMFIEENTAIVILVPLLMPVVDTLGVDPVQFGVIMVLNLGMGLVTPPFAPNLFVAASACEVPFHRIVGPALRLVALSALPVLLVVNVFPAFTTWFL